MTADKPTDVTVREVTLEDVALVVGFRTRMFRELGWQDEARLTQVEPLFEAYLKEMLPAGGCLGWIAQYDDESGAACPAGSVILVWQRVPPGVRNLVGLQAYVLGMYVIPEARRRGVARALMERAVECAVENGAPLVTLHASDLGRPLYERLGFSDSAEMRLFTDSAGSPAWGTHDESSD